MNFADLLAAVDAAFAITGRGLLQWADPHQAQSPRDEEYSRVTNPAKWRIVGARADAWLVALADTGVAAVERDAPVSWAPGPRTDISSTERAVPYAAGALPLVVARSRIEGTDDAGVTLGLGDPAVCVTWIPLCGCDACDSGSQNELDVLDAHIGGIVSGDFRRLSRGEQQITRINRDRWNASGLGRGRDVEGILARPAGWDEVSGAPWIAEGRRRRHEQ